MADIFRGVSVLTDNQTGSCGARICLHMLFMLCVRGADVNMHECLISSNTIASAHVVFPSRVSPPILYARYTEDFLPCGLLGNVTVDMEYVICFIDTGDFMFFALFILDVASSRPIFFFF